MKPYQKHVFICMGDNCSERGADGSHQDLLLAAVEQAVGDGLLGRGAIKVTQAQCLGACGFGPNVAVYPEGVWYYGVRPEDINEIVAEHLVAGRVVSRLLLHKFGETMPDEVVRDRVCGMVFHASEAVATFVYEGQTHYFCSDACLAVFRNDPTSILNAGHGHHASHGPAARVHSGH
ncbi:MAG: YHS domain-containing protein [Chloroflexi bacterium]|nr:YHS domain-containing protein [Chloroflexota bacterium]